MICKSASSNYSSVKPNNKLLYDLSIEGNKKVYRKLKNNYKYSKIYEDQIYNKVKMIINQQKK